MIMIVCIYGNKKPYNKEKKWFSYLDSDEFVSEDFYIYLNLEFIPIIGSEFIIDCLEYTNPDGEKRFSEITSIVEEVSIIVNKEYDNKFCATNETEVSITIRCSCKDDLSNYKCHQPYYTLEIAESGVTKSS